MIPDRSKPSDRRLEDVLRHLDAAQTPTAVDLDGDERARAMLQRVMATPVAEPAALAGRPGQGARPPLARRAVAVGSVAAVLALGSIVAPKFFGASAALAWSATPQTVTAEQAREAQEACDASIRESQEHAAGLDLPAEQRPVRTELRPVITELRGSLVLVYATDSKPAPSQVTCYVRDGDVVASGGSVATSSSVPLPPVAADSLHGDLGAVYSTPGGSIRGVTGNVGSDVVAVELDSVARGPVTATVKDGHFAAWWPDAPTSEAKENSATAPEITGATITLRDGSTRRVTVEELSGRTTEELGAPDEGGSATAG
jgi:hypothetical protein